MELTTEFLQQVSLFDAFSVTTGGFLKTSGQIARPGSQKYKISELGIGSEGMELVAKSLKCNIYDSVEVRRPKDEVVLSVPLFDGMPLVDLHQFDSSGAIINVTPDNFATMIKGVVTNPRADDDGNIHADITVWCPTLIDKIRAGQIQLSAHYKANLGLKEGDGYLSQRNIKPNNVASVPTARCGPACSLRSNIGDSTSRPEGRGIILF